MNLQIRKMKCNDYDAVASLIRNELGYSELNFDSFVVRMDLIETDPFHTTFVALQANQIVGFIGLHKGTAYELDGEYLRIIALAVSQKQQGQGIGTALLKYAENFAFQIGVSSFALNSGFKRVEAHAFYEKNGFIKRSFGFSKNILFLT